MLDSLHGIIILKENGKPNCLIIWQSHLKSHFKYLLCLRKRHPTRKLGMREPMGGESRGGEGSL